MLCSPSHQTASYPTGSLSGATGISPIASSHALQLNSAFNAAGHDALLPCSAALVVKVIGVQHTAAAFSSQRFGSSRFDASVPTKPHYRRGSSSGGGSASDDVSLRRSSCLAAFTSERKKTLMPRQSNAPVPGRIKPVADGQQVES